MAKYDLTNAIPFNEQPLYKQGYEDAIDKACECFELAEDWQAWANGDFEYAKSYFRKVLEEDTK